MSGKVDQSSGIEGLIAEIRKEFGPKAVLLGSQVKPPARLSTGIKALDDAMKGGWPAGRIVEVWGPKSAGKSTLLCHTIAACQRQHPNGKIGYIDLENTFEPEWAKKCGVDLSRLVVVGPVPAEKAGALLLKMIRARWAMAVIDSVVEMLPQAELEKKVEQDSYAPVPRVLGKLLPKVVVLQGNSNTLVLLVNQVRDKIGFFLGEAAKSPGGHALAHLNSVKLRVQRKAPIKGGDLTAAMLKRLGLKRADSKKTYGFYMAIKVVKSKVSREGESVELPFLFDHGIIAEAS